MAVPRIQPATGRTATATIRTIRTLALMSHRGYELVTTQELDRLRASDSANTNPPPALDPVIIHQQQVRDAENAWSSRVNSLERRKKPPTTTRRASSTSSSSAKTTTSSDDKKPSGKGKAKSRQQRR